MNYNEHATFEIADACMLNTTHGSCMNGSAFVSMDTVCNKCLQHFVLTDWCAICREGFVR